MSSSERECSKCGSQNIRYAQLRFYDYPLMLFFLRPYRCNKCQKRFFSFRTRQARKVGLFVFLFGGSIVLIWYVISFFSGAR